MNSQITPKLQPSSKRQGLVWTQILIETSFVYPKKAISYILLLLPYLQIFKYSFDPYIGFWTTHANLQGVIRSPDMPKVFSYLNVSGYTENLTELVSIIITIAYCLAYFLILAVPCFARFKAFLRAYKIIGDLISSFFYMFLAAQLSKPIKRAVKHQEIGWIQITSYVCLILLSSVLMLQNYLNFQVLNKKEGKIIPRSSNWLSPLLLFYILANEVTLAICFDFNSQITLADITPHLIVMNVIFGLFSLVVTLKKEIEEQTALKMGLIFIFANFIAIVMVDIMVLLSFWIDLTFWGQLFVIGALAIWWFEGYNLKFELQNINKWSNSQMMMRYTKTLYQMIEGKDDYFFKTHILGYIQVHNQKCDNEACPLKFFSHLPPEGRIEELIKKIYGDGCRLSPISQDLLLDFATFLYHSKNKQKSLKIILSIEKNELSLERLYYYSKLKSKVYGEISEQPNQLFLDIFSEMRVKDYENQIIKKFEESALANLEFWSVLNQDHPDFNKLYELGVQRVQIGEKVNELYTKICGIAHSEKITQLYIHYLRDIENDECLYSEIFSNLDEEKNLTTKIVIQDWSNTSNSVLIVSTEEGNKGTIIDLNTTCATAFGYEKYELISRNIDHLFPDSLSCQIQRFLKIEEQTFGLESLNPQEINRIFFAGCSNGYSTKIKRAIHHFNSLETGPSVIINIEKQFMLNSSFMLFSQDDSPDLQAKNLDFLLASKPAKANKSSSLMDESADEKNKILGLSSSCIQYLGVDHRLVQMKKSFTDIFCLNFQQLKTDKIGNQLIRFLNIQNLEGILDKKFPEKMKKEWFSVQKFSIKEFYAVIFTLGVKSENSVINSSLQDESTNQNFSFCFKITNSFEKFTYVGDVNNKLELAPIESLFSLSIQDKQTFEKNTMKNYAQNITTLRLHQNFIKVIEDGQVDSEGDVNQRVSETSTLNSLIAGNQIGQKLTKKDEEKILESHKTYCKFIEKNSPKSSVLILSIIFCLLSIGTYIASYFSFNTDLSQSLVNYDKILNKNAIIAQIAIAKFLIIEIKLSLLTQNEILQPHILKTMSEFKVEMQDLIPEYTQPFNIQVAIAEDPFKTKSFLSDQFFLSFAGYFDELYNQVKTPDLQSFNPSTTTLNEYNSWFIQYNGGQTKDVVFQSVLDYIEDLKKITQSIYMKNLFFLVGGTIIQIIFLIILFWFIFKLNRRKIEILEIFLESNQKVIQEFSSKTQSFLMTLHVEEANENAEINEEVDNKKLKHFSNMFGKKKRFKSTKVSKTPYLFIIWIGIISTIFYLHSFLTNQSNFQFVGNTYLYGSKSSQLQNILFTGVSNIKTQILKKYEHPQQYTEANLQAAIETFNSDFIIFQKQYLELHYKTFGMYEQFHQFFVKIYLQDICTGEIEIEQACQNPLTKDGVSIVITELTVNNEMIWDEILNSNSNQTAAKEILYYKNLQIIKHSHEAFRGKSIEFWRSLSGTFMYDSLKNLLIWASVTVLIVLLFQIYLRKVVLKDLVNIQNMLKFLPVSFVSECPKILAFINSIISN